MPNNRKLKKLRGKKWKGFKSYKGVFFINPIPLCRIELNPDKFDVQISFEEDVELKYRWVVLSPDK